MRKRIDEVLTAVKYSWKVLIKYACGWTFLIVAISLISAFSVIFQTRALEGLINAIADEKTGGSVLLSILLWGISIIAMNMFGLTNKYVNIHITEKLEKRYIPTIIDKYGVLDYSCFEKKDTQNLFQYVTSSSHGEVLSLFNISLSIISSIIVVIEYAVIFFSVSWIIGMVSLITILPLLVLNLRATYIEMRQRWTMTTDIRKRYYFQSLFADKNALQEIKIFNSKDYLIDKSEELTKKINKELKTNLGQVGKLNASISLIVSVFSIIVIFVSSSMIVSGSIMIGTYVVLIECIAAFIASEKRLASSASTIVRVSEKIQFILNFFSLPEAQNISSMVSEDLNISSSEEYMVEFSNVSFSYPDSSQNVLKNISFKVKMGEVVSFVGKNGCGKSTIVKLMCGLYKPDSGEIKIFGKPIETLTYTQIRELLTVVFQDAQHYQLSLRENVGIGNIDYIADNELLARVLSMVGAQSLLNLPKGLDQNLGLIQDDAIDLSGGEWQRVVIARALLSTSNLLIFDEPTASLDPIAECDMYKEVYDIVSQRKQAALLISHRLASGKFVDRIFVLDEGSVVEEGNHLELMKKGGLYFDMFSKQQSWYR